PGLRGHVGGSFAGGSAHAWRHGDVGESVGCEYVALRTRPDAHSPAGRLRAAHHRRLLTSMRRIVIELQYSAPWRLVVVRHEVPRSAMTPSGPARRDLAPEDVLRSCAVRPGRRVATRTIWLVVGHPTSAERVGFEPTVGLPPHL